MTRERREKNIESAKDDIEHVWETCGYPGSPFGRFEFLSMDEYRAKVGEDVFAYETVM